MQKLSNWINHFPPITRRVLLTLGITTLAFIVFSLATIGDLLAPKNIQEIIVNPVPIVMSIAGTCRNFPGLEREDAYRQLPLDRGGIYWFPGNRNRFPSNHLLIGSRIDIVVIPIVIAIQSLSEREFIWIVILAIAGRSIIQLTSTFKPISPLTGASAQTALFAQWASIIVVILFGVYVALNLIPTHSGSR